MGIRQEFQEFAMKGNVLDMAVGLIIGAAFGKIVTSLVSDVIMPPLGLLMGHVDFSSLALTLHHATSATPAVSLRYGLFINSILDFLIVAFAIFLVIKQVNRLKRSDAPPPPSTKDCPFCQEKIPLKATRCGHCTSELSGAA